MLNYLLQSKLKFEMGTQDPYLETPTFSLVPILISNFISKQSLWTYILNVWFVILALHLWPPYEQNKEIYDYKFHPWTSLTIKHPAP